MNKFILNKGFTLIELLVVIAIIGILASVVLASLNSARDKGSNAATKSNLNSARAQAELYYDSNSNSYLNVCTATTGILNMFNGAVNTAGGVDQVACGDTALVWAMKAAYKPAGSGFYCVDSTGKSYTIATGTYSDIAITACP